MTTTAPERVREEPPNDDEAGPDRRWGRVLALVLCGLLVGGAALRVAIHDPTEIPVSGDQSSFVLQAISIAGGDLSYDARDHEEWVELDWDPLSRGLFLQKRDAGWAFAKPYGYSLPLAPAIAAFGAYGITLVNAGLLLAYAWCWYAIGRTRWRPVPAALVATAATVASNAWPMAFPAHADLFVAVLVALTVLAAVRMVIGGPVDRTHGRPPQTPMPPALAWLWPGIAAVGAGMLVTEKLPALAAVGPLVALALWRSPWRHRIVALGLGALVVGASVIPYLHYSDGESWNAYGGDRYYAPGTTPFGGGVEESLIPWQTRDTMSVSRVIDRLRDPSDDLPSATLTYAVGRHTGAITYQPVVGTLAVAAAFALVRQRRNRQPEDDPSSEPPAPASGDDPAPPGRLRPWSGPTLLAATVGLVGYVSLYLITFTDNYFGGGQSVGNRYFLQVSVLVAVVPMAAGVSERWARWAAVVGAVAGVILIAPQLRQPEEAFYHLERISPAQELLPFDGSQGGNWRFECDPDETCEPPPIAPILGG